MRFLIWTTMLRSWLCSIQEKSKNFEISLIAGLAEHFHIGLQPDKAFATSVLFLVPGVPLINSVTDLMDGNIQNGMVRAMNGLMIAFSIAMGLLAVKMILNF